MGRLVPVLLVCFLLSSDALGSLARRSAHRRPAHYQGWLCVHAKEAAWNDADSPYFGGLQMGLWFMRTYAARMLRLRGTADHWTPLEQMWVAERAWKREDYSVTWLRGQWPTSYGCL